MTRILFVCTGNICRSPIAEVVLRHKAAQAGKTVTVESAGTGNWHQGENADARAVSAASKRGYPTDNLIARQVRRDDLRSFDIIYAMTQEHLRYLQALSPPHKEKVLLFLQDTLGENTDVPDPYFGGDEGFEMMLDLLETACETLVARLAPSA